MADESAEKEVVLATSVSLRGKAKRMEKTLEGVAVIIEHKWGEEDLDDPIATAFAMVQLCYEELTSMMQDVQNICRTGNYRSFLM